jgi:homoserine kinase
VRVRVPATSANLGPGFDAFGLALALHDDVVVRVAEAGLEVDIAGEGADRLPRTARHLVVRALRATFDRFGGQPRGLQVVCANRIPQQRGLGSSAAAIVAGVLAARALVPGGEDRLDLAATLALATQLEGHPDNVAAALLGGLTLSWSGPAEVRAVRLPVDERVAPVLLVPTARSSTARTRRLLPDSVPHADAAANAARAALLVHAVGSDPDLLLSATEDRLHQPYRATALPASAALIDRLRADGLPAVLSGAGPTVLVLATWATREEVAARARRGWTAIPADVDREGARPVPLGPAGAGE